MAGRSPNSAAVSVSIRARLVMSLPAFPVHGDQYPAHLSRSHAVPRPEYYGNPAGLTADVDVVGAIYAAFARRNLQAALLHVADDGEIHLEGTMRVVGRTRPYRGREGMREYFADVERAWEELTVHADDFRVIPGHVVVMGRVEGRKAGEAVSRSAVWTWRVRDGKAVSVRVADMGERG